MPTPSTPDTTQSHSFGTTCPDDQNPRSPSSWQPPPPYRTPADERQSNESLTGDEDLGSRSATMSPRPQSSNDRPAQEPESILPRPETEDTHKQPDTDEEMAGVNQDRAETPDGEVVRRETSGVHLRALIRRRRPGNSALEHLLQQHTSDGKVEYARPPNDVELAEEAVFPMGNVVSNLRVIPTTPSSFLRPGSKFTGTQQSERQVYDVQVEIKHVDLRESFLCGYLRIQGLTEDHPTLTTYFEGEIIGAKYRFMTKHHSWGANDRIDLSHWQKFAAFRPFLKIAKKNGTIKDFEQKENIFMRWKEHFLVPDHRVRTINGASFEGFYYICFNQVEGKVSGIYFHSKSEKFQQLELKHVEDKGCFGAMEFR